LGEEFSLIFELVAGVAEDIDRGGTDAVVFCFEEGFEEGAVDLVKAPGDPEGFEEILFVARGCRIKGEAPFLEFREDFSGGAGAEFAAGAVAGAILGEGEVF